MSKTKDLIKEHAGTLTSTEIAPLAGVTASHIRRVAGEMGISLRKPPDTVNPKRIYYASAPSGSECEFAAQVRDIMAAKKLPSQSAVLVYAVRYAAEAIKEERNE